MNPKSYNPLSVSWDITAAVVWLEALVLIISFLVGSKYPSKWCSEQFFLEFVKCLLVFVFSFPLLIFLCHLC